MPPRSEKAGLRPRRPKGRFANRPCRKIHAGETPATVHRWVRDFFPSPLPGAGMNRRRKKSEPRVPFGHPGLEIRHPLRGLGVQVIDGKSVLPLAVYNRLQFWDNTLALSTPEAYLRPQGERGLWGPIPFCISSRPASPPLRLTQRSRTCLPGECLRRRRRS